MSWGNFVTSWVDEKEIQTLIGKTSVRKLNNMLDLLVYKHSETGGFI